MRDKGAAIGLASPDPGRFAIRRFALRCRFAGAARALPRVAAALPRLPGALCALAALAVLAGCTPKVMGPPLTDGVAAPGTVQEGLASWYGAPYHGRRTASGEIYDQEGLTAAHRSLPFGTRIRVTNLANGRSLILRVNDRGPFKPERIVDLTRRAARELDFLGPGSAPVRLEVLRD